MKARSALLIAAIFVFTLLILIFFSQDRQGTHRFYGTTIEPAVEAYDFSLSDADGLIYRLSEQRNKVVLIFFGYTHCPDVCPTTLADFRVIFNELGEKAERVSFVYITVDPERDTPEVIARYAKAFNPAFVGLSGEESDLQPIYDRYGVFREKQDVQTADNYLMAHTSIIFVIDRQGKWRLTFPFELGPYEMVEDIRYLLDE